MTSLLIVTTGQTDVQLVVNSGDGIMRQVLHDKTYGALHERIEQRLYHIVDVPSQKDDKRASEIPAGDLTLCTPKLDAVLNYFTNKLGKLPDAVLILETLRTRDKDPRFAGAVLAQRLHDRGISQVQRHAFLEGDEQFDDPTNPRDAVVRRSVVASLEQAIAGAIQEVKPTMIFAATAGGFPAVKLVFAELTRLYALSIGAAVNVLEVPDAAIAKQVDRAVEERFHPAFSYRSRWQALSLIEKGNLLGAWGAVEHIKDQPGQEWTKVIHWFACFASSLPMSEDCTIPLLKHERLAVRAALRVEFALRAGDIPRAVHGTVAFFESALWDWLRQRDFTHEDQASGKLEDGFTFSQKPNGEKSKRFHQRKGETVWKVDDFKKGVTAWLNVFNKPALTALENALSDDIRNLRNDVAHNEPTPQLMNGARTKMQQAGLWSKEDPPRFLSQPLVQDVLKELGISQPDVLCEKLLEAARVRLLPSS